MTAHRSIRSSPATNGEIELLREYRTRLVADVVTGKLDVRTTAQLPDEVGSEEVVKITRNRTMRCSRMKAQMVYNGRWAEG